MGKRKQGISYSHANTYNPKAHESEERKIQLQQNLDIRRHEKNVSRLRESLVNYLAPHDRIEKPVDPLYQLKGAARAAQEYYRPPNYKEPTKPINVFETYKDRLYDHDEGREYLIALRDKGISLHNMGKKTRDASTTFQELLRLDPTDHLRVKDYLLRCYMDAAWGEKAREVIERYSDAHSSCFLYNKVLLEYISLQLNENGTTIDSLRSAMQSALDFNPFTAWMIAYSDIFAAVLEQTDEIDRTTTTVGSIEDAISYFEVDVELWKDTDKAIEWIQEYLSSTSPPNVDEIIMNNYGTTIIESNRQSDSRSNVNTIMYLRMFETGIEMIQEQRKPNKKLSNIHSKIILK